MGDVRGTEWEWIEAMEGDVVTRSRWQLVGLRTNFMWWKVLDSKATTHAPFTVGLCGEEKAVVARAVEQG
jgi:hypothetical protein